MRGRREERFSHGRAPSTRSRTERRSSFCDEHSLTLANERRQTAFRAISCFRELVRAFVLSSNPRRSGGRLRSPIGAPKCRAR